jgi:phosphonate transport system substrate-binding protein
MIIKNHISILIAFLLLFGCNSNNDLDKNGIPKKIVVAVYSGNGDILGSAKEALAPLKAYLAKKFSREVEFYYLSDYTGLIEALHSKRADIAYLSPFSYVIASQKKDIIPLAVVGQDGKPNLYHSVIFANVKTGIKNIDELKARAADLSISFSDPASTSGHLIPRAFLNSIGLNPDSSFKQVVFGGTHPATILTVASGKIDIGCSTVEYGLNLLIKKGLLKQDELRILWTSDPIVGSPVVIRNDLNKNFIAEVKEVYLNMAREAPVAFRSYIRLYHGNPEILSYIAVDDSLYNGIRKIAATVKDLKLFN